MDPDTPESLDHRPDWVESRLDGLRIRAFDDPTAQPGVFLPVLGVALLASGVALTFGGVLAALATALPLVLFSGWLAFALMRRPGQVWIRDRELGVEVHGAGGVQSQTAALADLAEVLVVPVGGRFWTIRLEFETDRPGWDLPLRVASREELHWLAHFLRTRAGVAPRPVEQTEEQLQARKALEALSSAAPSPGSRSPPR